MPLVSERPIVLDKSIKDHEAKALDLYLKGLRELNNRNYKSSIDLLTEAISIEKNPEYFNKRSDAYHWMGEYQKSVDDITEAIRLEPDNANYYNSRGISYQWLKEYQKSVDDLTEAIRLEPDNANYLAGIAFPLYKIEEIVLAFARIEQAIMINPMESLAYRNRGWIKLKLVKKDKADYSPNILSDLDSAIEIETKDKKLLNPNYLISRAEYFLYVNELAKAYSDLLWAIDIDKNNAYAYFYLSKYYEAMGDSTEQERYYERATGLGLIEEDDD